VTRRRGSADGAGLRIGLVVSRFNQDVTERLYAGALAGLREAGVAGEDVVAVEVPGALEIPHAARMLALHAGVDAVVAVGAVIRGETFHFDVVATQSAAGLRQVALETGVPVLNGILTTDTDAQALARAGGDLGDKGREAALGAVEMARLTGDLRALDPTARTRGAAR